jgi:uncharacterized protein YcbK (DUF882 family)
MGNSGDSFSSTMPMTGRTVSRRRFLGFAAATLAAGAAAPAIAAPRRIMFRQISLDNVHTGEALDAVYWADDYYIPQTMKRVAWVLRDFHSGDVHPIDPKLLDLLARLQEKLRSDEPFMVTSGYRSPRTNAWLAEVNEGVAAHSLHMQGMAVDVSLRQRRLTDLHDAALDLQGGGVGYYPASGFVHVDVGPVRRWQFGDGGTSEARRVESMPSPNAGAPAQSTVTVFHGSTSSTSSFDTTLRGGAGLVR